MYETHWLLLVTGVLANCSASCSDSKVGTGVFVGMVGLSVGIFVATVAVKLGVLVGIVGVRLGVLVGIVGLGSGVLLAIGVHVICVASRIATPVSIAAAAS